MTPADIDRARALIAAYPGVMAAAERRHGLPRLLLAAVASRETDCVLAFARNERTGDGGHGRGTLIDWARSDAFPAVFPFTLQAELAAAQIAGGVAGFAGQPNPLKCSLSAYNAGVGGASRGIRETGDSDAHTTGHDYGRDVLSHMAALAGAFPPPAPPAPAPSSLEFDMARLPELSRGATGTAVNVLQGLLLAGHAVGLCPAVDIDGDFGPSTDTAVRSYQRAMRLTVDGVVGISTYHCLLAA